MPSIEELVSDQSQHVRAALGNQLSGLAPILGKDEYVGQAAKAALADVRPEPSRTCCPCSCKC